MATLELKFTKKQILNKKSYGAPEIHSGIWFSNHIVGMTISMLDGVTWHEAVRRYESKLVEGMVRLLAKVKFFVMIARSNHGRSNRTGKKVNLDSAMHTDSGNAYNLYYKEIRYGRRIGSFYRFYPNFDALENAMLSARMIGLFDRDQTQCDRDRNFADYMGSKY